MKIKILRLNYSFTNTIRTITAIILILSLNSCDKKIDFIDSAIVPAARGYVKIKMDDNKNHVINISISNLAESSRLTPPKNTYVSWIERDNHEVENIGQVIQTKKLNVSLEAVSVFYPIRVFITAEDKADIQYPSGETILTTKNFNLK